MKLTFYCLLTSVFVGSYLHALDVDMVIHNASGVPCSVRILDEYLVPQGEAFTLADQASHHIQLDSGKYYCRVSSSETAPYSIEHDLTERSRIVSIQPVAGDNEIALDNESAE